MDLRIDSDHHPDRAGLKRLSEELLARHWPDPMTRPDRCRIRIRHDPTAEIGSRRRVRIRLQVSWPDGGRCRLSGGGDHLLGLLPSLIGRFPGRSPTISTGKVLV